MTRDEAMNTEKMSVDELLFLIIALAHDYDGYRKPESLMGLIDEMVVYVKLIRERLTIQSKPDAETGLVPCGCGGKVELCPVNDYYTARCVWCRITSDYYKTAEETIDAWNKAVGGQK